MNLGFPRAREEVEVRNEIDEVGSELRRVGRPVPASLRARVLQCVSKERANGVGLVKLGRRLGVSPETLRKWAREEVFVPVAIERRDGVSAALTVEDPASGLRVTGLDVAMVADLIRRMR